MRVAHVLKRLDPAFGGIVSAPLNMARASAEAGLEVEIWSADAFGWTPPPLDGASGSLTLIERRGPSGFFDRAFFDRFVGELPGVDVVHTHTFWQPYVARFVDACWRAGKPVVHSMHGVLMDHPLAIKTLKKRAYLHLVAARQLRRTTVVHMLNAEETRQSRRAGVDFRFFELPNGIDASSLRSVPRGAYRATEPGIADKIIILSMGRLHPIKGPDLLLGAFLDLAAVHPDIALVMAGPDEGMQPDLERRLAGHPAADRVRLPGLVGGDLRLGLLADADIVAQCSRHETASMTIVEAAFAGRCLLLTDRCHFPEVAEVDAGLVVPTSLTGVREGLARLLEERERIPARGANGRRLVEERFMLGDLTTRLIGHYEQILAGHEYPWILRGDDEGVRVGPGPERGPESAPRGKDRTGCDD
jgi:glycosyltransferase involved in cell wall biosynthesis